MGQSICPYFLHETFTLRALRELSVLFSSFSFPVSVPFYSRFSCYYAPRFRDSAVETGDPRRKTRHDATRRDFHSIVPRPSCAWPARVALGTGITIIRFPLRSPAEERPRDENEEQEELDTRSPSRSSSSPSLSYSRLTGSRADGRRTKNGNARVEENTISTGFYCHRRVPKYTGP